MDWVAALRAQFGRLPRKLILRGWPIDWLLYLVPLLLLAIGILSIYSITYSTGFKLTINQSLFAVAGIALLVAGSLIDYRTLRIFALPVYLVGITLLVVVLIYGREILGATRWLSLGIFAFQPSEIFKLILVIMLSNFLANRTQSFSLRNLLLYLLIIAIPIALLAKQPDLGTMFIILVTSLIMLYYSRIPRKHFFGLLGITLISLPLIWTFLKTYQKARIYTFLSPYSDPFGAGYNVIQSIIAVGSGGIWGKGLGFGSQSQLHFLPIAHIDFIFAAWAEATGFIGSIILIGLILFLVVRVFRIGQVSKEYFGSYLALGLGSIFLFQSIINIGMNLGLMPVTGIPLPFVSYGGSSLITSLAAIGILQSIYIRHKKIQF